MDAVLDYSLLQGGIWRGGDSAREKGSVSLHKEDRDADNQLPPGVCFIFPRALPALVGNNRVYGGWGMLVGYYLPGNRAAPPPGHRAGGGTANEEVEQGQFDPVPPERCP